MSLRTLDSVSTFIRSIRASIRHSLLLGCFSSFTFLISQPTFADPHTLSNVNGDEIIIYSDDSFKPAPRDFTSNPSDPTRKTPPSNQNTSPYGLQNYMPNFGNTGQYVAPKGTRSGRLLESLDTPLSDQPNIVSEDTSQEVARDDLWQRIKKGYGIPDSLSPLVKNHENWYSSRPDYVKRMVERSQRYLFHVVEEVEKRGMPTEIALLPMIESAYNPKAYSTSRASGIWQFIPSTGKHFGLKQNWWFDNRRNITFATDAALSYLQKLHGMFGAWDLALAAYNAGEGTVARAIERNRRLGLPTDYESINLPPETRNYVPKLQAVKNIMTNPQRFGLNIQTIANTPYFAKVNAPAKIDAHLAAKLAEISDEEFLALNPSFNRPVITSDEKTLELLLPIHAAQTFRTNLEGYNKPLVSWKTYFAKRGEHLEKIASKFGIHVSKLRDVNDLSSHNKIKKTAPILVPNGNQTDFKPETNAAGSSSIQANSNVTMPSEEIASADNQLITDLSSLRDSSAESEPISQSAVTHKVKRGDTLFGIAQHYGVTPKEIIRRNALKSSQVKIGETLQILDDKTPDKTQTAKSDRKNKITKRTYIVKRGDTLHSIAEKFDVAVADLKRWNKLNGSRIQPGKKLTIAQSDAV